MDTHQLEIFITSAQYLNFTKASKRLNMVPSAISYSISVLENELNTKLFTRDNNTLSLTNDGEEFLRDAILISTIASNAKNRNEITRVGEEQKGKILIGFVFPEFIYKFIPNMRKFHQKHPGIELQNMQYDCITIARMMMNKQMDLAFGRQDMFSLDSDIAWKSLYQDPFQIVMHKEHFLADKESITIPMLSHECILVMNRKENPGMFDMIQHLFLSHKMMPNINDSSNHHLTTLMLAAMNMGIVIIPNQNICYMKLPEELICKELNDSQAYHEIGIAWNKGNISQSAANFLEEFGIIF